MRLTDESNASAKTKDAPSVRPKGNTPENKRNNKKATRNSNNRSGPGKQQRQATQSDAPSALALSLKAALAGKSDD